MLDNLEYEKLDTMKVDQGLLQRMEQWSKPSNGQPISGTPNPQGVIREYDRNLGRIVTRPQFPNGGKELIRPEDLVARSPIRTA